jgi:hypothetical protein
VNANDRIVFRAGRLDRVDTTSAPECGCPAQHDAPLRASNETPVQMQKGDPPSASPIGKPPENSSDPSSAEPSSGDPSSAKDVKVQIDAPLVFHATGPPPKAKVEEVGVQIYSAPSVTVQTSADSNSASDRDQPPAAAESADKVKKKGFFRRVGGAIASIFH